MKLPAIHWPLSRVACNQARRSCMQADVLASLTRVWHAPIIRSSRSRGPCRSCVRRAMAAQGDRMLRSARVVVGFACLALAPSLALGQATITGVVRDASGAVLPGVTVEAASPVLIEKLRSATTDGSGQYRIIDLRPGLYDVSFQLPGFSTVRREGIELTGALTATVNTDLRVGGVSE